MESTVRINHEAQQKKDDLGLCPVVSCLYVPESLIMEAHRQGLSISNLQTQKGSRKRRFEAPYANSTWFYTNNKVAKKKVLQIRKSLKRKAPTIKLLVSAHQNTAMKTKCPKDFYEVEYISDLRIQMGQRYYLIKWAGWPEQANTWESVKNLNCYRLIEEFHDDYNSQLMTYFAKCNLSWNKLLLGRNGLSESTYIQRLFDAVPKSFKYISSYAKEKSEFRKKLREWQEEINKVSKGHPYIAVENEVNLQLPPKDFTYISSNIAGKGVVIPEDPLIGCECENDCLNPLKNCSCISNSYQSFKQPYKNELIHIKPGKPIYECNSRCKCSKKCSNRVVQNGGQYTLAIFLTSTGKGWGVKALQPIPKGAFVIEYVGEVITNCEAENRGKEYDSDGITYLFDLDYQETENPMTVDATHYGNVSHFINHSCAPNLQVYNVFIDNMDLSLPRIALFARKNISVNEELSFDYQMTGATDKCEESSGNSSDSQSEDSRVSSTILRKKCLCYAANCRGWLVM